MDVVDLVLRLGHVPLVALYRPNGRPLYVLGFLHGFRKAASFQASHLAELATAGVPLVGIDPSITLTYRDDYPAALGPAACPEVMLLRNGFCVRCRTNPGPGAAGRCSCFRTARSGPWPRRR